MAVVQIINSQTTKEPLVMSLVRRMAVACMTLNILIRAKHIPGKENILPDILSRFQMGKFHRLAPQMDNLPTVIPDNLLLII